MVVEPGCCPCSVSVLVSCAVLGSVHIDGADEAWLSTCFGGRGGVGGELYVGLAK